MTIQRTMVLIVRTYTERVTPWIRYSLIRLGLFGATFSILFFLGIVWWASALFATAISFTVSYIFFEALRSEVAEDLAKRVEKSRTTDDDSAIEDGALDSEGDR
jgi:divalent metal cation (Fe/Co/Zn/Cd) transporter